jgi:carbonic anhydrase
MNGKTNRGNVSRRNLLKFGAGAIGTGVLTAGLGSKLVLPEPALAENNITPDQALQSLIQGNRRFVRGKSSHLHQDLKDLRTVSKTQKPFASILSCADSRVPSEIIFDQGFGDLFVCRVAGNVVTNEEAGSLEFGALVLGAKLIMVMGHKRCGAVSATIKGASVPGKIGSLIDAIKPALSRAEGQDKDPLEAAVKANVLLQVENLKASPVISQLITEGKLKVVGSYFDLDTGVVTLVS